MNILLGERILFALYGKISEQYKIQINEKNVWARSELGEVKINSEHYIPDKWMQVELTTL